MSKPRLIRVEENSEHWNFRCQATIPACWEAMVRVNGQNIVIMGEDRSEAIELARQAFPGLIEKVEKALTEEAQKEYVEDGGCRCPFCGSDQIEGASVDFEGKHIYQSVGCLDCEGIWYDEYTLTGVQPSD